jgi:hypothetical protein
MKKPFIYFSFVIFNFFCGYEVLCMANSGPAVVFQGPVTSRDEDAAFRARVVGKAQVDIERALIASNNGVFVLFTQTQGTPLMISEHGIVPDGLIPKERMASYDTSVKPRVETTHQMPKHDVNCIFIRSELKRPKTDDPKSYVDDQYYQAFLKQHPDKIIDKVISRELFEHYTQQHMPAAFYYYIPKGSATGHFVSIFAKQINSPQGNPASEPGNYADRTEDRQ